MLVGLLIASGAVAAAPPPVRACTAPVEARLAAGAPATLPFDMPGGVRILLSGTLEEAPVRILLDSGAEASVVHEALARRLGLAAAGTETARGAAGATSVTRFTGASLRLGPATLAGLTLYGTDLGPLAALAGAPVDLILGTEFFDSFVIDIDPDALRITLHPAGAFRPPVGAPAVPLTRTADGIRAVPLGIEGREPVPATFDLGSSAPVALRPELWRPLGLDRNRPSQPTPAGGVGGTQAARLVTLSHVAVGPLEARGVPAMLLPDRPDGTRDAADANVGLPLLARARMIVDFCGSRLYLLPRAAADGVSR